MFSEEETDIATRACCRFFVFKNSGMSAAFWAILDVCFQSDTVYSYVYYSDKQPHKPLNPSSFPFPTRICAVYSPENGNSKILFPKRKLKWFSEQGCRIGYRYTCPWIWEGVLGGSLPTWEIL